MIAAFLISFLVWAILHSITASRTVKERMKGWLGRRPSAGLYRLLYNVFAVLTFLPVAYFWLQLPDRKLWGVAGVWRGLLTAVSLFGLAGATYSLIQTDIFDFAGLKQAYRYFNGDPLEEEQQAGRRLTSTLVIQGLYAYMRHPLYTFSMIFLWASPTLTMKDLIFNSALTLYFVIGSIYEEGRMVERFGQDYVNYQQAVPRFLPRVW